MKRAGITAGDIDYINAHGTSTPLGDEIELQRGRAAVRQCRRQASSMSSTKSATGHLLGAAGAVEAIFSLLAIRDGVAPPTLNLDNPSVDTAIDLVPHDAQEARRSTWRCRIRSASAAPTPRWSSAAMPELIDGRYPAFATNGDTVADRARAGAARAESGSR